MKSARTGKIKDKRETEMLDPFVLFFMFALDQMNGSIDLQ